MMITKTQIKRRLLVFVVAIVATGFWYRQIINDATQAAQKQLDGAVKSSIENQNKGFEAIHGELSAIKKALGIGELEPEPLKRQNTAITGHKR